MSDSRTNRTRKTARALKIAARLTPAAAPRIAKRAR